MERNTRAPGRARASIAAAVVLLAALTATGCAAGTRDAGQAPLDGTAGGSNDGAASVSGSPSASTAGRPADGPTSATASATGTAASDVTPGPLADGTIPASDDQPARNVPTPALPREARDPSEAGAQAAVRHFYAARQYLSLTGDDGPARAVAPDCVSCRGPEAEFVELYAAGGWSTGSFYEVSDATVETVPDSEAVHVQVRVAYEASRILAREDNHPTEESRERVTRAIETMSDDGADWRSDLDLSLDASFDRDLGHWVVDDGPYWIYDAPDALEGFTIKERT
jgi:hypothetical protein